MSALVTIEGNLWYTMQDGAMRRAYHDREGERRYIGYRNHTGINRITNNI